MGLRNSSLLEVPDDFFVDTVVELLKIKQQEQRCKYLFYVNNPCLLHRSQHRLDLTLHFLFKRLAPSQEPILGRASQGSTL